MTDPNHPPVSPGPEQGAGELPMIEKMARALAGARYDDMKIIGDRQAHIDYIWPHDVEAAKAALVALLEPDRAMCVAGTEGVQYNMSKEEAEMVFTDMIRQAVSSAEQTAGKSLGRTKNQLARNPGVLKITGHLTDPGTGVEWVKP